MSETTLHPELDGIGNYEYGWSDSDVAGSNVKRGLDEEVVRDISAKKSEPQWMLDLRLKGLSLFEKKPMPSWGSDLSGIFLTPSNTLFALPKSKLTLGKIYRRIFEILTIVWVSQMLKRIDWLLELPPNMSQKLFITQSARI